MGNRDMRAMAGGRVASAVFTFAQLAVAVRAEPMGPMAPARFEATLRRPLFSPTRRPPPPPPPAPADVMPLAVSVAPPPPPDPPPNVALSGIILGGGGGIALLRRPQDAVPVRIALGGQIDGWTLAEIRPRAVVLRRDARSVTVDLPPRSP